MAQKRRITAEDLYKLEFISHPEISPAGHEVAYVVTTINDEKEYESRIWLGGGKGLNVEFTRGKNRDMSPKWSPRGDQLAFVSKRKGAQQIWLIDRFGGEARQLTHMFHGASHPVWSPDGRKLALLSEVGPEETLEVLLREKTEADIKEEEKVKVKFIDQLQYKSDDSGFLGQGKNQIWLMDLRGGTPVRITGKNKHYDAPVWSPDGQKLVTVTEVDDGEYKPGETELVIIDLKNGMERTVTPRGMAVHSPTWSPDGTKMAVFGHQLECKGATQDKIWIIDLSAGVMKPIAEKEDLCIGDLCMSDLRAGGSNPGPLWSYDGEAVFTVITQRGSSGIYRIGLDGQVEQIIGGDRQIFGFSMDVDRQKIAFVYTSPQIPGDLAVFDLMSGKETRLTALNNAFLQEVEVAEPQEFNFTSYDGLEIQGWVIKPVGFTAEKTYPVILEIHGGPHAAYSNSFFLEFQLLAAEGYGVIYCNPRGSQGYGQRFVNAVRGDYGGRDYEDLMACVDHALNWDWVDRNRLGVTGGSYGGFMTNWIVGHTDRFKAAVTQRCISNWLSFAGVSDIGYFFCDWEHKLDFIKDRELLMKISPITYVENIKTPLLILHSENDYRCPMGQAEELYISLKYLRKTTKMVLFPGGNHNLSRNGKPEWRVVRLQQIIDWFNQYI